MFYGRIEEAFQPDALEACVQRFSPEHQPRIALRGAPAAARTAEVERPSLEQQYGACRKERNQCQTRLSELEKGQQALGKRALAGEALTTDLSACKTNLATLQNEFSELRDAYQQAGLQSGAEAIAAFPDGAGSTGLGVFAVASLVTGFLLGRTGQSRRLVKLAGGIGGAILAFLVFIGLISLLPDSQWPELLLAVTVATLTVSLTALWRFARLYGRGGKALSADISPDEDIDLDEAERALASRRPEKE